MVQDQALLAGVDHGAVIQLGELLGELRFLRQVCQLFQEGVVNLLGAKVIRKATRHGQGIAPDSVCARFAFQGFAQVNPRGIGDERLVCIQLIEVFPVRHLSPFCRVRSRRRLDVVHILRHRRSFSATIGIREPVQNSPKEILLLGLFLGSRVW